MDTITIKDRDRNEHKIEAIVYKHFAVHRTFELNPTSGELQKILETEYTITHVPTGASLIHGWDQAVEALKSLAMVYKTITNEQAEKLAVSDFNKAAKLPLLKKIARYLDKAKTVANNIPLEKEIGVFYKDRSECEKLRIKLNPENNKLLDDNALLNPGTITDLMMGKLTL